jgi:D-amino peptidase
LKVFISVDMEGVAGVVHPRQGSIDGRDYEMARRLMTRECNAAIEGAIEAGVQEFVVNDSHAEMYNLVPEELHAAAEFITGSHKPLSMCQGMGPGFDAAFFVGYHAAAGTQDAVIDHTYASRAVYEIRINGKPQSEASLNAALCGYFQCPMALVTGDAAAVSEAHLLVNELEGVVVKEGMGRHAARSLHPELARRRIRTAAQRAIERLDNIPVYRHEGDIELELDFLYTAMADQCERVPGVRRLGGRTVGYRCGDYMEGYKLMLALVSLGTTVVV